MRYKRLGAVLAAAVAFAAAVLAAIAVSPYAWGLFYGCFPRSGSCGDGVGWAMLISAPLTIPIVLVLAGAVAVLAYRSVMRAGT